MSRLRTIAAACVGFGMLGAVALAQPLMTQAGHLGLRQSAVTSGDTTVVFGPMTFATPTGSSANHVETFSAADPETPHVLLIEYGDPSGSGRPQSATIILNGSTIATEADFASGITAISPPVGLLTTNTLQVTLSGSAGDFVKVTLLSYADGSVTLFGPKTYQRSGSGKDVVDTFVLPAGTQPPYRIHLRSGDLDGTNRPASAYVLVNGVTVFPTSDFKPDFAGGVREVSLTSSNTITVGGLTPVGSRVTIRVTGTDAVPPVLSITTPANGTLTREASVVASGTAEDASPVGLAINGQAVPLSSTGAFNVQLPLEEGPSSLVFVATDAAGNVTQDERQVIRDATPPALSLTSPEDGLATREDSVLVSGTVTDAGAVDVLANAYPIGVAPGGSFAGRIPLDLGPSSIVITATDAAGNQTAIPLVVVRDTAVPAITVSSPADGATVDAEQVTVSGSVADETAVSLTVNTADVTVGGAGAFSTDVSLASGANTIRIEATDAAGNVASVELSVTRSGVDPDLPPDPATVAPPLDRSVPTTTAAATEFLYTGANPIQRDVAPGTINPIRAALLRGQVMDGDGSPLPGARVEIKGHAEFGHTLSRADGMYDMVVNGGGVLTIDYTRGGYLPVQRVVEPTWDEYVVVEDVALIQRDTVVTTINFISPIEVARGSTVTDADGTRTATLLFQQGTQVELVMPDSSIQTVSAISVRATEYTVGEFGQQRMPAPLPPTSAYTYAVEYSVDEADALGATEVRFDRPVFTYLEDFIGFDVGDPIPHAYYDRARAAWVPTPDGRVVAVLSTGGGAATLDVDGSGQAATQAALDSLGVTSDELAALATLYAADDTLWRVSVDHFTPRDSNWPFGFPPFASPPPDQAYGDPRPRNQCTSQGSIIGCENQTLGESIPLVGTPFQLMYTSDRVRGRAERFRVNIPITPDVPPDSIARIRVEISVAGRSIKYELAPAPNLNNTFVWDGLDAYGRPVHGRQRVKVRVGYEYKLTYSVTLGGRSFGTYGSGSGIRAVGRGDPTFWTEWNGWVGVLDGSSHGVAGWALDAHHTYHASSGVLYRGDGTERSVEQLGHLMRTVAGNRTAGFPGQSDSVPAMQVPLPAVLYVEVKPDGGYYASTQAYCLVREIRPDGLSYHVAGVGCGFSGDGGPARDARIGNIEGMAVGPDGSLYVADAGNNRVRKIDPSGIITTFAGTGAGGYNGDGIPAVQAQLNLPYDVAVASDGTVYIADRNNRRIRRIDPDGIIMTVVGTGSTASIGPDTAVAAATFNLNVPHVIDIGPDGSLYIGDYRRIRRVRHDGMIYTVAGTGNQTLLGLGGFSGDGGPATSAQLNGVTSMAVGSSGEIFFVDSGNLRVRRVDPDGTISTIAGTGQSQFNGSLGPATAINMQPFGLALTQQGTILVGDRINHVVREIASPMPEAHAGDHIVADENGVIYVFDTNGRHQRTVDRLGTTLLSFLYDAEGRLASVTDLDGLTTTIERDSVSGGPTGIRSPYGQLTTLETDTAGLLTAVISPAQDTTLLTYQTGGLLATFRNARGNTYTFTYDAEGRLAQDDDPASGYQTLAPTGDAKGAQVTRTTALQQQTEYAFDWLGTGTLRRTVQDPDGFTTTSFLGTDESNTTILPDSTVIVAHPAPDPRFGMQSPILRSMTVRLPSGLTSTVTGSRRVSLSDPADLFSLTQQIDTLVVNGRVFRTVYNGTTRRSTSFSPLGRTSTTDLDSAGRVIRTETPGIEPVTYTYDSFGRLSETVQGTRIWQYGYDALGRLETMTDPLLRVTRYTHDDGDRVTGVTLPDSAEATFGYDRNGNLISVTPPGRQAHTFSHTAVDLTDAYNPPSVGGSSSGMTYSYDLDRRLTTMTRPDSLTVEFSYGAGARLQSLTFSRGLIDLSYDSVSGRLNQITAPGGISLSYELDGDLLTRETWAGPVTGEVAYTYNTDFLPSQITVAGGSPTVIGYDSDGLLSSVGSLTLARDPSNGMLTGTTLGSVTTTQAYDAFGALDTLTATYGSAALFSVTYRKDALDRIIGVTETIDSATSTFDYEYDLAARLTQVMKDSVVIAVYGYDDNGNRTSFTDQSGTVTGAYDDQDRLLSYGAASYAYTANGELSLKVIGSDTTRYTYDEFGNLLEVSLPDGTEIEYLIDGANRRVGRIVDGATHQKFLYSGLLRVVAELDSTDQVVSRFYNGTAVNVPEWMEKGGTIYRLITDHLGSVRMVVNTTNGQVAQRIDYDAFGAVLLDTNPGFQPFGFAGGLYDGATALVRYGARDYDASVGRWISKDPILFRGGDPNLYAYALGNPVSYTDPFGLCTPWPECRFQAAADWGAQRGGALGWMALNGGAALNGASEALGTNQFFCAVGEGNVLAAGVAAVGFIPAGRAAGTLARVGAKVDNLVPVTNRLHLSAAAAELRGALAGFDHVTEVRNAMNGLRNSIHTLNGVLGNPAISAAERELATQTLGRASRALDAAERVFR